MKIWGFGQAKFPKVKKIDKVGCGVICTIGAIVAIVGLIAIVLL
jgi:hypothetical protein